MGQLSFRTCNTLRADSVASLRVNASSIGHAPYVTTLPLPLRRGALGYVELNTSAPIEAVELSIESSDGWCVDDLRLSDQPLVGMLPLWMDNPCQGFHSVSWGSGVSFSSGVFVHGEDVYPCAVSMTWHVGPTPPPPSCHRCHNGGVCSICLEMLDAAYCPPTDAMAIMTQCHSHEVAMGALCEGDGECGTDEDEDTCPGEHHQMRTADRSLLTTHVLRTAYC